MTKFINYRWYNKAGHEMVNVTYYDHDKLVWRNGRRSQGGQVTTNMLVETWLDLHDGIAMTKDEFDKREAILKAERVRKEALLKQQAALDEEMRIHLEWEAEKFRDRRSG